LALTLGFERVCCTLFGSAECLDSGLVCCGWFDDFSYSHQVFSLAQRIIFTTSSAGFVASRIKGLNLSQPASDFFQYFNPSNACLQVVDLIDFFLLKLPAFLKKVPF
jgi:hypothetical protein